MASAFTVAYTATPLAANTKVIIEATPCLSAGVSFAGRSKFRSLLVSAAAAVSPADIEAAYVAKYGVKISGRKIFVRATVITSDGQRSAPLQTSVTVV